MTSALLGKYRDRMETYYIICKKCVEPQKSWHLMYQLRTSGVQFEGFSKELCRLGCLRLVSAVPLKFQTTDHGLRFCELWEGCMKFLE